MDIYIFASCGRMLPRYFLYPASLFRHPDIIVALSYTVVQYYEENRARE